MKHIFRNLYSVFIADIINGNFTSSSEPTTLDSSMSGHRLDPLDSSYRLKPYVDFTRFYRKIEKAKKDGILTTDFDI